VQSVRGGHHLVHAAWEVFGVGPVVPERAKPRLPKVKDAKAAATGQINPGIGVGECILDKQVRQAGHRRFRRPRPAMRRSRHVFLRGHGLQHRAQFGPRTCRQARAVPGQAQVGGGAGAHRGAAVDLQIQSPQGDAGVVVGYQPREPAAVPVHTRDTLEENERRDPRDGDLQRRELEVVAFGLAAQPGMAVQPRKGRRQNPIVDRHLATLDVAVALHDNRNHGRLGSQQFPGMPLL